MHVNEIIYALICINNHIYHVNLACYQMRAGVFGEKIEVTREIKRGNRREKD